MVKKKKKKKQKQKKPTRLQRETIRELEKLEKEEDSNINPGAVIGGILFILWIIFKIAANS